LLGSFPVPFSIQDVNGPAFVITTVVTDFFGVELASVSDQRQLSANVRTLAAGSVRPLLGNQIEASPSFCALPN